MGESINVATSTATPAAAETPAAAITPAPTATSATAETPAAAPGAKTDLVAAPTAEAPNPEDKLSKGFAELTRREKKIRAETEAHKQELADAKAWVELKNKLKDDPGLFLSEVADRFGVSLDAAAAAYANKLAPPTVESRIEKLEKERIATEERATQAAAKAQEEQVAAYVEGYRTDIRKHVESAPDDYQALQYFARTNKTDVGEVVTKAAERHYQETGKVLDPSEAAKLVEQHLAEEIVARVKSLSEFKRFSQLFGTPAAAPPAAKAAPRITTKSRIADDDDEDEGPRALTNRVAATGKAASSVSYGSEDPHIARALNAMRAAAARK